MTNILDFLRKSHVPLCVDLMRSIRHAIEIHEKDLKDSYIRVDEDGKIDPFGKIVPIDKRNLKLIQEYIEMLKEIKALGKRCLRENNDKDFEIACELAIREIIYYKYLLDNNGMWIKFNVNRRYTS